MNDSTIIKQQPLLIQSIFRQQIKSHLVPQPLFVRRDSNGILTFFENLNGEWGGPWLCFLTKISKGGTPAALISSCSSEQCPTTVRAGLFLLVTLSLIAYHGVPAPFDPLAKFPVGTSCDTNNNNNLAIKFPLVLFLSLSNTHIPVCVNTNIVLASHVLHPLLV